MANSNRRRVPGVTIYQRGKKWSYTIYGEPDILTGKRDRTNAGGFESEDDAWASALRKHAEMDRGRNVKPSTRTVEQFLSEWLSSVKHSLKPSAYANYSTNVSAYIIPKIGHRRLQDISVPILNAFYVHLLETGRVKTDGNGRMYEYWRGHRTLRNGLGPTPTELSKACGTSYQAAKEAVCRYRRGPDTRGASRWPVAEVSAQRPQVVASSAQRRRCVGLPGLQSGRTCEPAPGASPWPKRSSTWSVEELAQWLRHAQEDRFAGMWVLAATTGMRRSELLGVRRDSLNLDTGTLTIDETLISVAGRAEESNGKTEARLRTVSLDAFTIAALQRHLAMLDVEQQAFGPAYPAGDWLYVWENGQRPHPDTVTNTFNRLVDAAGAQRIRLHDIRHTYSTLSLDSGIEPKILSDRVGHSNPTVTFQIYAHRSTGRDRAAAELIGHLIEGAISGSEDTAPEVC